MINPDQVYLRIDGAIYSGWKAVSISMATNALCSSFRLEIGSDHSIQNGQECALFIGTTQILVGYIDAISASFNQDSASYSVSGRDKTADLIDCSYIAKPNAWANQGIFAIARDLAKPFEIGVIMGKNAHTGAVFPKFAIEPGETPFEALERLAKQRGLLLNSNATGDLVLDAPEKYPVSWTLSQGVNIQSADFDDDARDRFSEYHIKGGQSGSIENDTKTSRAVSGVARDKTIIRYRPKLIISDEQSSSVGLNNRAGFEATAAAAKAQSINISLSDWRAPDGNLWSLNTLVPVKIPAFGVDMALLISEITFEQSENRRAAHLKLSRPESFTPEPLPEPELPKPPRSRKPRKKATKANGGLKKS